MGVSRPTFPVARLRQAYDVEQVDLAVDHILENLALPRPRIDAGDITAMRFTPGRGGYDMAAVDDWLDEVVAELRARGAGGAPGPAEQPAAPQPAYAPTTSTAITEVRSGSSGRTLLVLAVLVVLALAAYSLFG
ncbi:DivIVA domain-containing protein [Nocardioides sp. J2M5]|uniref:DivIVA domain-containing protein n=1 Tax=Nocardioides palaemonis TaxID=2829810 RepID=UPI001BAAD986|nr:DivIVA domain-containing protein [Nocardioides palaemonis]MBS2936558.1 DivIVA domain-containing protein [Nocardioides palaemonis]